MTAVSEAAFVRHVWDEGLRPDQRQFLQLRQVSVEFPWTEPNQCVVQLGKTVVSATVNCALVEPTPWQPKHGFLECSVSSNVSDNGSGVAPVIRRGYAHRSPQCQEILRLVQSILKQGKAIDTESLCALPGRRVWSLCVDVVVMNDDGNASDAAVWAAMGALQHFRRPELSIRGDEVIVHPPHERDPVPLSLHHVPLAVTCALVSSSISAGFVVDPSLAEAAAATALVTIALNAELQPCVVSKRGGCDVSYKTIRAMVEASKQLTAQLQVVTQAAMADHASKRAAATLAQFEWAQKRTGVGRAEGAATDISKRPRDE